jgi:hypothetical protein
MKLISKVEISGFRSIQHISLPEVGDFTAFAGLNNAGKSNIIRAMNAFFNGQTDDGKQLNVDNDYYRPDLKKKKAKKISIMVAFSLPDHFKFRKGLESVESLLGDRQFEITKVWHRQEPLPKYRLNDRELNLEEQLRIDHFLQLISFRYIPNRVLPIDVVRKEHQALRDVLVRRLGSKGKGHDKAFQAIQETSESMIKALVLRLVEASPDIGSVRLATPTSWADMVFTFGYRLGHGDIEVDDAVQGSGIQSLLMFETLYLIDKDYFQKFGWRQAAIWAVEEPESSLHTSLEAKVDSYLSLISQDPSSRLQLLCTTHSDLMIQYATTPIIVKKDGWKTECKLSKDAHDALDTVSRAGISRWAHPILHHPLEPVILVEGKYDAVFLEEAFKHIRPKNTVRVANLEMLERDGKSTGGVDDLLRYVKANAQAIKTRQKEAPVIVVLDWDSAKKAGGFQKLFNDNDPFIVISWPERTFNPKLNKSFRGIERHYSDRLIEEAEKNGVTIYKSTDGICSIANEDREQVKRKLSDIVKLGLKESDLEHARSFIEKILSLAIVPRES